MNYTVAQFRKETRKILNAVDNGAEVYIERYGKRYRILPELTEKTTTKKILRPKQ